MDKSLEVTEEPQRATFVRVALDVELSDGLSAEEIKAFADDVASQVSNLWTQVKSAGWTKLSTTDPDFKWD